MLRIHVFWDMVCLWLSGSWCFKGSKIQNVGNHLPSNTLSQLRRHESSQTEYFSTICTKLKKFFTSHEKSTAYSKHSKKKYSGFWQMHIFVIMCNIKWPLLKSCGFPRDNTECARCVPGSKRTLSLPITWNPRQQHFTTIRHTHSSLTLTAVPLMKPSKNRNATLYSSRADKIHFSTSNNH